MALIHEVLQVCLVVSVCFRVSYSTHIYQEPADAQQTFSASTSPTVSRTIPVLEFLQNTWENMAKMLKFSMISNSIKSGLENLRKWYRKTDDTNVYFCCLSELSFMCYIITYWHWWHLNTVALDPNYKLAYAEEQWDTEYFEIGKERLETLVSKWSPSCIMTLTCSCSSLTNTIGHPLWCPLKPHHLLLALTKLGISVATVLMSNGQYRHAYMRAAIKSHQASDSANQDHHQELIAYLSAPVEEVEDVVAWWGVSFKIHLLYIWHVFGVSACQLYSRQFPTLAHIAKDYLAIQGSSTPSECAFSSSGITATPCHNSLQPTTFSTLQIVKFRYCNGHLSAVEEATSAVPQKWVPESGQTA